MRARSIALIVADEFQIAPEKIFSKDRWRHQGSRPRHAVYFLAHTVAKRSWPQIAKAMDRNLRGVIRSTKRFERYMAADPELRAKVDRCMARMEAA